MPTFKVLHLAIAMSVSMVLGLSGTALAQTPQKKISYEEAYKRCKAYIDAEKGGLANSTTNEQNRIARGAACMRKFGHRL